MAKLKGNIWALVQGAAREDKRNQLLPQKPQAKETPTHAKPGQPNLRLYDEEYVRVRLMLPKSMNREIDRYFFDLNKKGKNEFLVKAIEEHMKKKGIQWPKK